MARLHRGYRVFNENKEEQALDEGVEDGTIPAGAKARTANPHRQNGGSKTLRESDKRALERYRKRKQAA